MGSWSNAVFWVILAFFFVVTILRTAFIDWGPGLLVAYLLLGCFVFLHGERIYGWRDILVFFAITSAVVWCTESLSIATGFPFGDYYYTDPLKLGEVPWIVMPVYFGVGYLCWVIAHTLLGLDGRSTRLRHLLMVPMLAAFVMVMWDVAMDPISSAIDGRWVWEGGGFYFGVPMTNFFGWFLTTYLFYQIFTIYMSKRSPLRCSGGRSFWLVAPLMYLGMVLPHLIYPFSEAENLEIYWPMSLVTVFTMVFVSILSVSRVFEDHDG